MRTRIIAVFILICTASMGHEIRPGYLQITETGSNTFDVYWRIPSRGDAVPKLDVVFPDNTEIKKAETPALRGGFANFRYQIATRTDLAGYPIRIDGLEKTLIDVLVRLEYQSGEQVTFMLQPDKNEMIIPGQTSTWQVVQVYTILGIEHILFGFDHLLFVLALVIIARGKWKIVKTVTAFTIAHSITLSLASLGLVQMPGAPVEAVIALSIVFLAMEIMQVHNGQPTLTTAHQTSIGMTVFLWLPDKRPTHQRLYAVKLFD